VNSGTVQVRWGARPILRPGSVLHDRRARGRIIVWKLASKTMNTEQDKAQDPGDASPSVQQQQQQHPQGSEGHGGQGSESALKQLRAWEQHRAANSGGKRRQGPV
jgi:hypothetical protein